VKSQTHSMSENKYKFGNLHLKNAKEVSDYTTKVLADAENLITNVIPDKIFFLEKLDKEEFVQYKDISSISKDVNIPNGGYGFPIRDKDNGGSLTNCDGHVPSVKKTEI